MREMTTDALVRLTCAALERTAFLMAEPGDTPHGDPLPNAVRFSRIEYRGPERGEVLLAGSDGFVRKLAAGFLGDAPASIDSETVGADALRELSNIVAGSLVRELGGDRCPFAIGLPTACDVASLPLQPTALAILDVEGERLEVYWTRNASALFAA